MDSAPLVSLRALRRGSLRSLLLGLPLCSWVLFLSLDQLLSGRWAIALGSALGTLALGFLQLPTAVLEDLATRRPDAGLGRGLLAALLSWLAAALGVAAASLQADYAQTALRSGPDEARALVLDVLGSPARRWQLAVLGLSLALPFAAIAFSRVREAGARSPGLSQTALLAHYGLGALLGAGFLLLVAGLDPCLALGLLPVVWGACVAGAITYDVLDFLEAGWFPAPPGADGPPEEAL